MSFLNFIWLPRRLVRVAIAALIVLFASSALFARLFAAEIQHSHPSARLAQPAPNCAEVVVNGGFEQTAVGWKSVAGASLFSYATDQYIGGQHSLLLGYTAPLNIPVTFGVEQSLTLPAESSSIEFGFHYAIQVEGEAGAGDQAYLTFIDVATNQLLAMLVLSPTNGAWSMGLYDLTPLAGKNVRLAFSIQDDGEPGKLTMRVDEVSVLACLPPEAFALQPLATPTPTPLPPEPLLLAPQPLLTATPESLPTSPQLAPSAPQESFIVPQTGSIDALAKCSCGSSLYACADFSSWAVAQACYTQCQVAAGYDIHNLDQDRNGVACELELQDVAPLDATPSPQATPSPVTQTNSVDPNAPLAVVDAMPETQAAEQPSATSAVDLSPGMTTAVAANGITTVTTDAVAMGTASSTLTTAVSVTETIAAVPTVDRTSVALAAAPNVNNPAAELSSMEMLTLLLLSPLGYLALGALVVIGALGLWIAYLLGQRRLAQRQQATTPYTPDEFDLQPSTKAPAPKA